ncbi:hypothetical protein ABZ721_32570 [Streptomyces sp. NPDC006733]|uniref:hypothetical protein n=1 Tax=Streptomyces sp. NPDC006733 TaxID=3155460 RepID=UPI00340093F3
MYELELHRVRATELQRQARQADQARALVAVRRDERRARRAARREGRVSTDTVRVAADTGRVGRALRGVRHHAAS